MSRLATFLTLILGAERLEHSTHHRGNFSNPRYRAKEVVMRCTTRLFVALTIMLVFANWSFARQSNDAAFFKQFLRDEVKIWSSPARMTRHDANFLGALVVGSGFLLRTDRAASEEISETDDLTKPSHTISSLGAGIPMFAAPAGLLAIGKLTHHDGVAKTGNLGLMAAAHAAFVAQTLKLITGRQRPTTGQGRGLFWKGGSSFPSGHSMSSWAFATVVARRSNSKWIKFGSYSFAAAVAASRVGGRNHFPADVLVGSAGGYLIGRYVTTR